MALALARLATFANSPPQSLPWLKQEAPAEERCCRTQLPPKTAKISTLAWQEGGARAAVLCVWPRRRDCCLARCNGAEGRAQIRHEGMALETPFDARQVLMSFLRHTTSGACACALSNDRQLSTAVISMAEARSPLPKSGAAVSKFQQRAQSTSQ